VKNLSVPLSEYREYFEKNLLALKWVNSRRSRLWIFRAHHWWKSSCSSSGSQGKLMHSFSSTRLMWICSICFDFLNSLYLWVVFLELYKVYIYRSAVGFCIAYKCLYRVQRCCSYKVQEFIMVVLIEFVVLEIISLIVCKETECSSWDRLIILYI